MDLGGSRSIAGFSCCREKRRHDCRTAEAHCLQHSLQGSGAQYIIAAGWPAPKGDGQMIQKPSTDNGLKIGDRVKLVSEMPLRKGEMDLEGEVGEGC
jgi:hypothetical protein